jgi:hypothetical protein
VEYSTGNLYRVDTSTLECTATTFQVDPNLTSFGMGFVFDPLTGVDTLYVAGNSGAIATASTLATLSFPDLTLHPIASLDFGSPELTGTGDGQLWGFAPATGAASGLMTLAQLDPATGALLTTWTYPGISNGASWAVKFWGGSFWLFLDSAVYQVDRATGLITNPLPDTGRNIVGAGVSTCAPIQ